MEIKTTRFDNLMHLLVFNNRIRVFVELIEFLLHIKNKKFN